MNAQHRINGQQNRLLAVLPSAEFDRLSPDLESVSLKLGQVLKHSVMDQELARYGVLQRLPLRYTQALFTQTSQTAGCNRHKSVQQQLCRWLLLSIDRLPEDKLTMTQSLIADMLGERREGVWKRWAICKPQA